MRQRNLAGACLVLALFALTGGQCSLREAIVRIPDFDSRQVEGVWFFRLNQETGEWEREAQIVFSEVFVEDGTPKIQYATVDPTGTERGTLDALVARDPQNPDEVTLRLWYLRWLWSGPGRYKISAFNASGESELSDSDTWL